METAALQIRPLERSLEKTYPAGLAFVAMAARDQRSCSVAETSDLELWAVGWAAWGPGAHDVERLARIEAAQGNGKANGRAVYVRA